jgi:hypothetical protein
MISEQGVPVIKVTAFPEDIWALAPVAERRSTRAEKIFMALMIRRKMSRCFVVKLFDASL